MNDIVFRATTRGGKNTVEVIDTGDSVDRYAIKQNGSTDYADTIKGVLAKLLKQACWKEDTFSKIDVDTDNIGRDYLQIVKMINDEFGFLYKSPKGSRERQFYFDIIRFIAQNIERGSDMAIEDMIWKAKDALRTKGINSSIQEKEESKHYNVLDNYGGTVGFNMTLEDANDLAEDIDGIVVPISNSRKPIKSETSAAECFGISEEEGEDVEELRSTFENDADFRAALEDYFDIYNDYAVMSEDDFNKGFKKFIGSSVTKSSTDIESSKIGDIKNELCLGQINDKQAMIELELAGKSEKEAEKMVERWKQSGVLKSSVDKAVTKAADYFGTEPAGDTINCQDIITYEDEQRILEIADEEDVQVQIGQFSVRFYENPEQNIVKSSLIDKYIQKSAKLVKDVNEEEEMSKEENERRTDEVEKLGLELMDKKDDSLVYDEDSGKYTINGDDIKGYIIDLLGDNYFDDNRCWDYLFDSILPELRDYATNERVVRSCYEIYEKRGSMLKLVSNTFDKEEALSFKNHGFFVKANKEIVADESIVSVVVAELQELTPVCSGYSMVALKAVKNSTLSDDVKQKLSEALQNEGGDLVDFHDTFVNLTFPELGKKGCIELWKKMFPGN